jgi:hypothetical protein
MRRSATLAFVLPAAVGALMAGCQPTRYVGFPPPSPDAPQIRRAVGEADPGFRSFYLWGLLPRSDDVDARAACGSAGIAAISTERSAGQAFLYVLSAGVFSPVTARIDCGPAAGARPDGARDAASGAGRIEGELVQGAEARDERR